jgi:hypothetical protein
MKTFALLVSLFFALPASADTLYKCVDKTSDSVLFTNQKVGGKKCTVMSQVSDSGVSSKPRSAATPTPADFPKVTDDTQRARDNNRRTILELEMANEQKFLEDARKTGDTSKAQLHERNVAALQKEIGNLK